MWSDMSQIQRILKFPLDRFLSKVSNNFFLACLSIGNWLFQVLSGKKEQKLRKMANYASFTVGLLAIYWSIFEKVSKFQPTLDK